MEGLYYEEDDQIYHLEFPVIVEQIRFDDYCDFQSDERIYINLCKPPELNDDKSNQEEVDTWEMPIIDAMKQLSKTVSNLIKGDIQPIPFTLKDDNAQELIDEGYSIHIGDDLSIMRLYAHLLTMIRDYKPKRIPKGYNLFWFKSWFRLTRKNAIKMLTGSAVSTGEAVEVLEYQRRFAQQIKERPLEIGNLDFTLGITEFAILVRKRNERLPWDRAELTKFITERRELFKGLPLSDVLSLRFFLLNCLMAYAQIPITDSSGRASRPRVKRIGGKRRGKGKR